MTGWDSKGDCMTVQGQARTVQGQARRTEELSDQLCQYTPWEDLTRPGRTTHLGYNPTSSFAGGLNGVGELGGLYAD